MTITRTEALTLLGAGTQPGPLAFARLINELFDRIEALEAADTAILAGIGRVFSPHRLYQSGDILLWYDPSDLTTMFKNTAGTQPVTADGDSVALMLDKGQWGGKTFAEVMAAQPPVLDDDFSSYADTDAMVAAGWDKRPATNGSVALVAGEFQFTRAASGLSTAGGKNLSGLVTQGKYYQVQAGIRMVSGSGAVQFAIRTANGGGGSLLAEIAQVSSTSIVAIKGIFAASSADHIALTPTVAGETAAIDWIIIKEIPGYHRIQATGTSMPKYKTDGTLHWLLYDGTDDSYQTPTINWGTDEVSICAGVTKLSDAAGGVVAELSATSSGNLGAFGLFAPGSAAPNYFWRASSIGAVTATTYTSPITKVLTGQGKIATDLSTLRIDGAEVGTSTADQGAGNFRNDVLYFGRRGGSTLPFNGKEHQTIIRSRLLSAGELAFLETFVAAKTGITL